MIKKKIKYYIRPNSFVSNIPITKKDIKELDIKFTETKTKKSRISINDVILLKETEFNQINIHNESIKSNEKTINDLKETIDKLNNTNDKLSLELSNIDKELSNKEILINTLKSDNKELKKEIEQININTIDLLKEHSESEIKLNQIINKFQIALNTYETIIKSYNNLGFFSRLFNTKKLNTIDKTILETEIKNIKKNKYIPIETMKE